MEKYNQGWFKERAFKSLKKISDNTWDYSDSLLLYISSGVEVYESVQNTDTPYFKLVTQPEHEYLRSIAKDIVATLPNNFEYIDLGPGTEHKEQFFFDEIKKEEKTFTYIPVDISDYYLKIAETNAIGQGIKTRPLKTSFEELPEILGKVNVPRFVSLGLTVSNFNPQEILKLLANIAGKGGFIFISTQIRDRTDMIGLQKIYQEAAPKMCEDKIKLIGLMPEIDTSKLLVDDNLKMSFTVLKNNMDLEKIGVKEGEAFLVFQSLRYTKESLEDELKRTGLAYKLLDNGSPFIASIIKI
jgi:uncharacterized SAM-dependent methyltransferase